jgi:hypothetical protein
MGDVGKEEEANSQRDGRRQDKETPIAGGASAPVSASFDLY